MISMTFLIGCIANKDIKKRYFVFRKIVVLKRCVVLITFKMHMFYAGLCLIQR